MKEEFQKYIDYHRHKGGTGKLYDFELIDYKTGFLKKNSVKEIAFCLSWNL